MTKLARATRTFGRRTLISLAVAASVFMIGDLVPAVEVPPLEARYENGLLVLDATRQEFPFVSFRDGTSGMMNILVRNMPADAAGFTLTDPQGVVRFRDQISSAEGKVWFWDVAWTRPQGEWDVSFLPGVAPTNAESITWDKDFNLFGTNGDLWVLSGKVLVDQSRGDLEDILRVQLVRGGGGIPPIQPPPLPDPESILKVHVVIPDLDDLPNVPTPLEGNSDEDAGPPSGPPTPGCAAPQWRHRVTHYKWVNKHLIHSPNPGTATTVGGWSSGKSVYAFGNGQNTQEFGATAVTTDDGKTVGKYDLHIVSYYTNDVYTTGCPDNLVVIGDYKNDQKRQDLMGASDRTDEDDLEDWWSPTTQVNWNVKALTLHHRFESREDGVTTQATGTHCDRVGHMSETIHGIDADISFSYGNQASASIGGNVKFVSTDERNEYFEYCFGTNNAYEWDTLGGAARAFKSRPTGGGAAKAQASTDADETAKTRP